MLFIYEKEKEREPGGRCEIDRTTSAHVASSQCFPLLNPPVIVYNPHKPTLFSQLDVSQLQRTTSYINIFHLPRI